MLVEGKLERFAAGGRSDQRPGRPGRLDRRPGPGPGRGQGLLDARRAGAPGAGRAGGSAAARRRTRPRRGRGLPRRGPAGHELRLRAPAAVDGRLACTMLRTARPWPGAARPRDIVRADCAWHLALRRFLGRPRPRRLLHRRAGWPARCPGDPPGPVLRRPPDRGHVFVLIYVGFGIALPLALPDRQPRQRQRPGGRLQADRGHEAGPLSCSASTAASATRWPAPTRSARWARTST